ncbi:MFS transporter [Streptomyces chartreusis]|uniref:MFS transporter n=1 Tax=Streptomyces chartreusis TaxID=1969 RepID=UPI00123DB6EC|nr:MFS transporter [Streptomyces chartreusis]QEV66927.1 MFS transporter [Streptomyces chartreusis]GGX04610.1 MFS transporter [Streptomyces chartreusis]
MRTTRKRAQSGGKGAPGGLGTYREVIGLTGPLLPVVSFPARLPTATIQFGSVLLVARTSGSLAAAGLTGGALAVGQVVCGPLVGRLADRHGQRAVVLVFSLANALAIAGLVAGALMGLATPFLALLGACAGATVPQIGPMARARLVALARRAGARDATVGAALSFESTVDEISFVLGPALVGLAAVTAHPAYALGGAAVLVATCGTGFALHRTAAATRPGPVGRAPAERRAPAKRRSGSASTAPAPARTPLAVHSLRAALALQGAMFGACQAGITALTERLGQPDQTGLVYAAMGVMSAVAGLCMAAVPARVGLTTRWRAATAAACALSLPLLWTDTLPALYATVTVLGVAYAPHLITVFGLTERVVPPTRLAEAMALATSALVGGQALAVAVTGRLAESHGPAAAFGAASLAAALACLIALTARPESYTGRTVEESDRL